MNEGFDDRPGAGYANKDYHYLYDGLDRLIEVERGVWNGSSMTLGVRSQEWSLDMLGNWESVGTDTNGDGAFGGNEVTETRSHNQANEIVSYDRTAVLGGPFDYAYDAAGNLRSVEYPAGSEWSYTHDAWNRLVKVETDENVTRSEFEYNGLHWRTVKRDDAEAVPDETLDQRRHFYYNANWQLIEERIDEDYSSDPGIDRVAQQVWGPRYIDDAVVRRVDGDADGDYDPGSGPYPRNQPKNRGSQGESPGNS